MEYNEYDFRCESEEILRRIKSLDINDPLRDELLDELEEERLNEDQDFACLPVGRLESLEK